MPSALTAPLHRVRAVIEAVDADMSGMLDESSTAVTDAIHDNVAGLPDELYVATRSSTRANIGLITAMVGQGGDPAAFTAPEEALAYARSYVHEGLTCEHLTRVYREGEQAYLKLWLRRLRERARDPDELAEAMSHISDWLFRYIETITGPLTAAYTAEHERWIRGSVAMRCEEVRSILADPRVDPTEAGSRLRYRLEGRHVAFVIWDGSPAADPPDAGRDQQRFGDMERLGDEVVAALKAKCSLAVPFGSFYAGWATVAAEPDLAGVPGARGGLRVALGRPGRGLDGFRRSHQEALRARRVAALARRPGTATATFDGFALDALLTQDLDEARRFVVHELGPLAEDSDASRRIAATLEIFLDEGSSFVRTGRRLGIHENTVAYRIRRAEELLAHRVSDRAMELRTALRLTRFVSLSEHHNDDATFGPTSP